MRCSPPSALSVWRLAMLLVALVACDRTAPVVPPATTRLQFVAQPTSALAGSLLTPVVVEVTDDNGNTVTSATPLITVSATPTGSILGGTLARIAVAGRATFDDLSICEPYLHALTASAAGLASATTGQFSVLAGPPIRLKFIAQPSGAKAGVILPAVAVATADSCGNGPSLPPGGTITVTLSLGANPGGAVLSGTLTRSGFAALTRFDDIVIDKPGTGYTLVATVSGSPNMAPATSVAFTIAP
jgi:hypothetical protein